MGWEIVTILCTGFVFLSPAAIVAIVLRHRERMAAMKNKADGAPMLLEEIKRLRAEMNELRQTTTHFDMSFDAALQRVEQRIESVETGPAPVASYPESRRTNVEESPALLRRGL
jgi:hypothetical protein